ncbi:MAG: hypothetical protein DRQ89_15570 [Epsilonproteobacteria bacterium]|nr:MAG: hypothetical protein DRQ89_15570 [Campylobacterota bacterium]
MNTWQLVTNNSTLPVSPANTFWDHLNNLGGGSGEGSIVHVQPVPVFYDDESTAVVEYPANEVEIVDYEAYEVLIEVKTITTYGDDIVLTGDFPDAASITAPEWFMFPKSFYDSQGITAGWWEPTHLVVARKGGIDAAVFYTFPTYLGEVVRVRFDVTFGTVRFRIPYTEHVGEVTLGIGSHEFVATCQDPSLETKVGWEQHINTGAHIDNFTIERQSTVVVDSLLMTEEEITVYVDS